MDALRCLFIQTANQILVNVFGHERNHRSRYLRYSYQCGVECHVRIDLILLHALRPETLTASSDIPVTHIIDEILERSCSLRNAVVAQIVVHLFDEAV